MANRQRWIALGLVLLGIAVGIVAIVAFYVYPRADTVADGPVARVAGEAIPWIGIDIQNVGATTAEALNLRSTDGVVVTRVLEGSPADAAGMMVGDVIVRFARQRVPNVAITQNVLASLSVGDTFKVNILQDGSRKVVYVTIGARPSAVTLIAGSDTAPVTPTAFWGMVVSTLSPENLSALNLPEVKGGVLVVQVYPGGLAAAAGILPGDVIVKVNKHKVEDLAAFYKALTKDDAIVLDIYRNGLERLVSVDATGSVPPLARIAGYSIAGNMPDSSGSSNRSSACICLYCGTQVVHPAGVACADLVCPVCGQRMASPVAGAVTTAGVPSAIPPMGQPTAGVPSAIPPMGQPTAGVPSAIPPMGQPTAGVPSAIPPMGQPTAGVPSAIPPMGQPTAGVPSAIPPMGQPTAGTTDTTEANTNSSMGPQVERPDNRPPPIGGPEVKSVASQATTVTYIPVAAATESGDTVLSYVPIGGQPDTIPPMGQTTGGQPDTIPPMGQTTGGQPDNIPPMGQTTGGQPDTIPPMGQTTGGQPDTIPPMGQTTGGQPDNIPPMGQTTGGQPDNIPPMGQTTAGGAPVGSIPASNLPNAGTTPSTSTALSSVCVCPQCLTTVYHPLGVPCSSMSCPICGSRLVKPTAGQPTAGQPTAGQPTAGQPTAGAPVGTIPPSNLPGSTDEDAVPGSSGQGAANLVRTLPALPLPTYTLTPSNTVLPYDPTNTLVYPRSTARQGLGASPAPTGAISVAGGVSQGGGSTQGGGSAQGGAGGYCLCPTCGTKVEHVAGIPCTQVSCPVCGSMMVRDIGSTAAGAPDNLPMVAVAVAGSSLESNLAVFETATNYVIIDLSTGRAQIVPNPNANDPSNTGAQSAQLLVDRGADTVIARSFGDTALKALAQLRTEAVNSVFGSVRDAIASYFNMLNDSDSPAAPSGVEAEEEGKKYGLTKDRSSGKTKGDEATL